MSKSFKDPSQMYRQETLTEGEGPIKTKKNIFNIKKQLVLPC